MDILKINGGNKLTGEITLHGAKNSALPILSATILVKGVSVLHNCPKLKDVDETLSILEGLGCKVKREGSTVTVDATDVNSSKIDEKAMRSMRSSILFLGSLLSRCKEASIFLPGGCDIGARPIDIHINALKQLGAEITENGSSICCKADELKGTRIVLPFCSVGATENIIISSAISNGTTTIINPAREPEIVDLANFLNSCGADISGAGNSVIEIKGVKRLHSCNNYHSIIPDRILASTYMSACAITGGDIMLNNVKVSALTPVFPVFSEMGCKLYITDNTLRIKAPARLKKVRSIKTLPYPGFPTDSQSMVVAALSTAKGTSVVKENIFENRFRYVNELNRFGTDIEINDRIAIINGVDNLHSANVFATDLRGGAALVIAALKAEGESTISYIEHIDRGYESIENNLALLGADIKRIKNEEGFTEEKFTKAKSK